MVKQEPPRPFSHKTWNSVRERWLHRPQEVSAAKLGMTQAQLDAILESESYNAYLEDNAAERRALFPSKE